MIRPFNSNASFHALQNRQGLSIPWIQFSRGKRAHCGTHNRWDTWAVLLSRRSSRISRGTNSTINPSGPNTDRNRTPLAICQRQSPAFVLASLVALCSRTRCCISLSLSLPILLSSSRRINMSDDTWFIRAELFSSLVVGSLLWTKKNEIFWPLCQGQGFPRGIFCT